LLQSINYSGCRRRSTTQERKESFKFTQRKENPIKKMQINQADRGEAEHPDEKLKQGNKRKLK